MSAARLRRLPDAAPTEFYNEALPDLSVSYKGAAAHYAAAARPLTMVSEENPVAASRVRILIADAEASIRETFAAILANEGYETHSAASGTEALEILAQRDFDIL